MKYAKIKEYEVSRVGIGVAGFGVTFDESESLKILDCYTSAGGNLIDTANVYMNWDPRARERASSEKALGRLFKSNPGLRRELIVCTKGAHYEIADMAYTPRVNEGCITYDIDDSLRNLGIDRIDLYWLHRDNPTYPVHLIIDALLKAQDEGKIAYFGASNWSAARIADANAYARSVGREGFVASQIMYSYVCPLEPDSYATRYFDEALDGRTYRDENIALFSYTSLAKGYMTKMLNGAPLNDRLAKLYDCPVNRDRAARAAEVAGQIGGGHNAEQVGLAYLHALPYNTVTLVSFNGIWQLKDSMNCDIDLTPEQLAYLTDDKCGLNRAPQPER